jgi:hypothetical protein
MGPPEGEHHTGGIPRFHGLAGLSQARRGLESCVVPHACCNQAITLIEIGR